MHKELYWAGSSKEDLSDFPDAVKQDIGYALWQAQQGFKSGSTKPLKGFGGAGVLEIIDDFDGDTYRAVYAVKFEKGIFVLHCFQKKSKKGRETPKADMDLIKARLKQVEAEYGSRRK